VYERRCWRGWVPGCSPSGVAGWDRIGYRGCCIAGENAGNFESSRVDYIDFAARFGFDFGDGDADGAVNWIVGCPLDTNYRVREQDVTLDLSVLDRGQDENRGVFIRNQVHALKPPTSGAHGAFQMRFRSRMPF
jgi:hypothetical protein